MSSVSAHPVPAVRLRQIPPLVQEFWPAVNRLAGNRTWPPDSAVAIERFLSTAESCRLLPFVANDPEAPPPVLAAARARWHPREADDRSLAFDRETAELVGLLHPGDYFLFKGAVYRYRLYPDRTLRPMDDIDIVTRPGSLRQVLDHLQEAGYRQAEKYLVRERKDVKVEVMARLAPDERFTIDYEEIWNGLEAGPVGARHPAPHHELVLHAMVMAGQM